MSRLIIMRHAETIFNEKHIFSGQLDISLSPKGIKKANKIGDKLKGKPVNWVFTSSMKRATETAAIILQVYYDFH